MAEQNGSSADAARRRRQWSAIAAEKKASDAQLLGAESVTYLQHIVNASQVLDAAKVERQIDKDVTRVPIHVNDPAALKRILTAFAVRYEEGGYCQGLNFIASLLLSVVCEEEAFWLVCLLVEDILPPGFYSTQLHGSKAELHVLTQLVQRYLPNINPLLARWSLTLEPFAFSWVLCLFVGELPLHLLLAVWDALLTEGVTVLSRAGLSLLRIHEKALSAADSMDDAMLAMQSHRAWAARRPSGQPPSLSRQSEVHEGRPVLGSPSINGQCVHAEVYHTVSFLSALQLYDQVLPAQLEGIRRLALSQLLCSHASALLRESQLQLAKHGRGLLKAAERDAAHAAGRGAALDWARAGGALGRLERELQLRVAAIEAGLCAPGDAETGAGQDVDACGGYAIACRLRGPVLDAHAAAERFVGGANRSGPPLAAGDGPPAAPDGGGLAARVADEAALKAARKVASLLADLLETIDQQRGRAQPLSALSLRKAREAHRHDRVAKALRTRARGPDAVRADESEEHAAALFL